MSPRTKNTLICSLLTIFLAAWFSILMPWDKLPDPDAFYHATMAKLTWEQGPVTSFPWLDLTTLGSHFADQHFLLHVLQSPFVHFFGLAQGSRISSLLFAVLGLMGAAIVFYKLRLRPFWLWPLLLALSYPFSTRMVLGKASPLVVLLWLVGLATAITPRRPHSGRFLPFTRYFLLIFLVSLLFTLTHGGWIILPGSILLLIAGNVLFNKAIAGFDLKQSIKKVPWSALVASLAGVIVGVLLHPGRSELLSLLWLQVVKIGLIAPTYALPMGQEWNPTNIGALIAMISTFGVVLLLIVPGLIFARSTSFPLPGGGKVPEGRIEGFPRLIISWSLLIAVLTALTLKSVRFVEYFLPALAIWTAALAQLVDWKKLFAWLSLGGGRLSKILMPSIVFVAVLVIISRGVWNGYDVLHNKPEFIDDQYLSATKAISEQAQPNDRVYHSQWDEFPILFSRDQRLRYVAGLDPNFFYEATSTLALDYLNLPFHATSSTKEQVWSLIHDKLGAKFALIDTIRWPDLAKILDSDSRYKKIGQGQGGAAYRLQP
ncbi:MAG: hypothetical protein PHC53_04655 [Patescibacteria group bacterium]|nr:hypothetical protein [Patescibacteria group bacterium]